MGKTLVDLVGRRLSSVEFVQDYIQLRFDGPCLTVNARISVEAGSARVLSGGTGFCDALCGAIGKSVAQVKHVPSDHLDIVLEDLVTITVSLRDEDQVSPEAAVLSFDRDTVVVG